MPIGRLDNVSPTVRSRNTDYPVARLRESPHASTLMTGPLTGNPIGLLLALTYAEDHTTASTVSRSEKLFIKIRNTD